MAQQVEFNWGFKVRDLESVKSGRVKALVKNGVRIFPVLNSTPDSCVCDLLDWDTNVIGTVKAREIKIKQLEDVSEEEARDCGFSGLDEFGKFMEENYGKKGEKYDVVTIVYLSLSKKFNE